MPETSTRSGPIVRGRPARPDLAHGTSTSAAPMPRVRRRASVVPWGVLGAIGLIVAIEWTLGRNWLDLSDPVSVSWRYADDAASHESALCNVLFLGDSLVKHGLIPSVVERESGIKSVNLAAARAPALMTYFALRRALESGAHPRAIVINTKPAVLIAGVDYNAGYWPSALSARECIELGRITGKATFGVEMLVARLFPSIRSRLEVRSQIMAALNGTADPISEINRVLWRNWSANGGANVASLNSAYRGELSPQIRDNLHPDRWYVDRSNAKGIELVLGLARVRGIRVFWLLPPISPGLQQWRERSGSEASYEDFVRAYQARYPSTLTVLDARRVVTDPSSFIDATHLAGRGAIVLSRTVAAALRDQKAKSPAPADGWRILEPPAGDGARRDEVVLEDLDRSKEIVRGQ
ncbi:MAG: hypothetical protein ACYC61_01940 [Isosphaeraceae bacterium]